MNHSTSVPPRVGVFDPLRRRAEAEYLEMPGLKLTAAQAARGAERYVVVVRDAGGGVRAAAVVTRQAEGKWERVTREPAVGGVSFS